MSTIFFSLFFLVTIISAAAGFAGIFFKQTNGISRMEYFSIAIALGFGIISLITLGIAAIGLLHPLLFFVVIAAGNGFFLIHIKNFRASGKRSPLGDLGLLLVPFLLADLFYCLFPPTFYDSMMYHLAIPNLYLMKGGMVPWVTNFNASLPLNGEMLYLFTLMGGGLHMPKLISLVSGVLIAILLYAWFRDSFQKKYSWLPALAFLSIPQVGFLMSASKPDLPGMLFLLAGCRMFFIYAKQSHRLSTLLVSGSLFGLAVGTKYIFGFYLGAFLVAILLLGKDPLIRRIRSVLVIGGMTLLLMAPWFIKNQVQMGNPVYPYLNRVFHNHNWDGEQAEMFSTVIRRGTGKTIPDYLLFPFRIFLTPYSYGVTAVWGLLFLLLLPLAFFQKGDHTGKILLVTGCLAHLFLLPFAMVPRYFLPVFLFLAIPVARGANVVVGKSALIKKIFTPVVILAATYNLVFTVSLQDRFFKGIPHVRSALAGEFKGKKVNYLYGLPYFAGVEFMNRHLSDRDRVIFLGEDRTFYLKKDFIASSFADRHPLLHLLRKTRNFNDFNRELQALGITHIFYTESGLERMGKLSRLFHLNAGEKKKLTEFLGHYPILYRDAHYTLHGVKRNERR